MKFEGIQSFISKSSASFASIAKVLLMSKGVSPASDEGKNKEIAILGNGPTLRDTIDKDLDFLLERDLMAVNFAALAPDFYKLRPKYYVLADGHFFDSLDTDNNVRKLWEAFGNVSWEMTLLVPTKFRHLVKALLLHTRGLNVRYFNLTPIEGFRWIKHWMFKSGLGMPRPRNVMIPAIMEALRLGYRKIYLFGADHTWTKTLDVDEENFVVSIQPHFYKDNEEEHRRVRETYKDLKLHDVLGSMVVAFRSYWEIADYAKKQGVEILNATPGSMIDAFPRYKMTHPEDR
ncbi:MAG: hypothetical protein J1E82_08415 [Muribaculaceae bacterium]|nr:hypothetical protein [Muribaculaceae bacterium]